MNDRTYPLAPEEADRLAELRRYQVLDTAPEQVFDDTVQLTRSLFGVQTSVVSLIDDERQWFKAKVGLDVCETDRDVAFCTHAILQSDVMVILDAKNDTRFADNPLVTGAPFIGLVVMAVAWYGSNKLSAANAEYSKLTNHSLPSATKLARVVRLAVTMDLSGYQAMAYDGASAKAKSSVFAEKAAYTEAIGLLNEIDINLPGLTNRLRPIRTSIDELHELARQAIALGLQNKNEEARAALIKADDIIGVLAPTIVALNGQVVDGAKTTSEVLRA